MKSLVALGCRTRNKPFGFGAGPEHDSDPRNTQHCEIGRIARILTDQRYLDSGLQSPS